MYQQLKRLKLFLFVFIIFSHPTNAQVKSGTLIVFYLSPDKVVIAADSRTVTGPMPDQRIYGCKIFALGQKTLFTWNGALGFNPRPTDTIPMWLPETEARKIYVASPSAPLETIIKRWKETVVDYTNRDVQSSPTSKLGHEMFARENVDSKGRGILGTAFFFSSQTVSDLKVFSVTIVYDFSNPSLPVSAEIEPVPSTYCELRGHYCAVGRPEQIKDFLFLTSERAKADANKWESELPSRKGDADALLAKHLVELGVKYDQTGLIGGTVDVAILRRNGTIKWVANPNCKCE